MEAFPHQHPSFLLESVLLPNTPINISDFLEEGYIKTSPYFPYSSPSQSFQEVHVDARVLECSDNGDSETEKPKTNYSSMAINLEYCDQINQKETQVEKKRKIIDGSSLRKEANEAKVKKQKKCSSSLKEAKEKKSKADKKNRKKVMEEPPTGFVHVRARRGEATDSHSLAERVRRKKITELMNLLQSLVPGCDMVTSKTLVLDEIINYVKFLQHQVEFLSMKLAHVNPTFYNYGVDFHKSEDVSILTSTMPSAQHSIPTPCTAFADATTTFTTTNNYPLLDSSVSFLHQLEQKLNATSQVSTNISWEVDHEEGKRFINQSDFPNLSSFR